MRSFGVASAVTAAAALFAGSALAQSGGGGLDPIVIKGAKFFYKTNGTEL